MISLDELKTIKPRQIKLLQENGITSVAALAMSSPDELAEIDGMSEKASKMLVWDARHELGMGEFQSVSELLVY